MFNINARFLHSLEKRLTGGAINRLVGLLDHVATGYANEGYGQISGIRWNLNSSDEAYLHHLETQQFQLENDPAYWEAVRAARTFDDDAVPNDEDYWGM